MSKPIAANRRRASLTWPLWLSFWWGERYIHFRWDPGDKHIIFSERYGAPRHRFWYIGPFRLTIRNFQA